MLQETATTWDLRTMLPETSTAQQLYALYFLSVFVLGTTKLAKIWRAAPPFRTARRPNDPGHLQMLQRSFDSLKQWILCTLLVCGISASVDLTARCIRLWFATIRSSEIVFAIHEFSVAITMGFLSAFFIFLVRWHLLRRIEHLRQVQAQG